ncbi:VOC family protein [Ornithinimicrobium tianjinense]|nr:VOC family protein [Ornithinimicrobium tianjinense]
MAASLDHVVLVTPDLEAGTAALAALTGVQPVAGGAHPGLGSRNALVGLRWRGQRRCYLELLAPDPAQPDVPEDAMMLDLGRALAGVPAASTGTEADEASARRALLGHTWAVRPDDLDAALASAAEVGLDVGTPVAARRMTPSGVQLSWRLAVPRPLGLGGVQPFLIDWGGGAHPSDAGLPVVDLIELELEHPEPRRAGEVLRALGVEVPVRPGPAPRLRVVLDTPRGRVRVG